jgi:hypothetical protein
MKILFWIKDCDYRFYVRQKTIRKFYVNKALTIDQNQLYWKRYATINKQWTYLKKLNLALEKRWNGDHELDTWLFGLIFFNS